MPSVVKRWVAEERGSRKQTERGMRGIFIGFAVSTKGYLFYMPGSRNIIVSADATFDETFHSAIATTWQQHRDTLALQPSQSYIPDVTTTLEHTGTLDNNALDVEEGETQPTHEETQSIYESAAEFEEESELEVPEIYSMSNSPGQFQHVTDSECAALTPTDVSTNDTGRKPLDGSYRLIVDSSNNDPHAGPRRSARQRKPNPKYASGNVATVVGWANACSDLGLAEACAAEAHPDLIPQNERRQHLGTRTKIH
jgi:hypothetical protein